MDNVSTPDVVIIRGDWNAIVGDEKLEDITGGHGLGTRNEQGDELVQFFQEKELVVTNKFF